MICIYIYICVYIYTFVQAKISKPFLPKPLPKKDTISLIFCGCSHRIKKLKASKFSDHNTTRSQLLGILGGPRADRSKWRYGAPVNGQKMGNWGYFTPIKWSYFTLLITGFPGGPPCIIGKMVGKPPLGWSTPYTPQKSRGYWCPYPLIQGLQQRGFKQLGYHPPGGWKFVLQRLGFGSWWFGRWNYMVCTTGLGGFGFFCQKMWRLKIFWVKKLGRCDLIDWWMDGWIDWLVDWWIDCMHTWMTGQEMNERMNERIHERIKEKIINDVSSSLLFKSSLKRSFGS